MEGLPAHWLTAPLNDVAKVQSGGTPSRGVAEYWNGKIPWVKISDIDSVYVTKTDEFITEEGLKNSSARIFPKGTILLTIFATIGRVGILKIDAATNQAIAGITPLKQVEEKFFYYALIHYANKLVDQAKGVAQKNINLSILKALEIPLPPYGEQKRIVAKLDTMFGHLDQLKARLENIPVLLKQFRQAVLTQAVTGKLTEEWRGKNKLEEVNITKIRKEGKLLLNDRANEYDLSMLPEKWNWRIISEVADVKGGKRLPKGEQLVPENTGLPYIKAGDLKNGTVLVNQLEYLLPEIQERIKRYTVDKGDVYMTNVGACIGDAGIIPDEMDKANLTENALKMCNLVGVYNLYLAYWLRSPIAQGFIQRTILSGAQGKLALGRLESFPIPLAPLKEQKEIVRRVESLYALADRVEVSYIALQEKIDHLPQAILAKAFRGELVKGNYERDGALALAAEAEAVYGGGRASQL